jgi:hypothetical protein
LTDSILGWLTKLMNDLWLVPTSWTVKITYKNRINPLTSNLFKSNLQFFHVFLQGHPGYILAECNIFPINKTNNINKI